MAMIFNTKLDMFFSLSIEYLYYSEGENKKQELDHFIDFFEKQIVWFKEEIDEII